ncbi:CRISPR-associated helicase Cas3' [Clostridium estertheticum]|uniref:CRISPR-associated helicase Cas3' n=1 Tax=Clostridium estertheticum TaxID=238834 RepID=UPI001C7DC8EF|nr:CRISPR-associated helicase Cas3' [Clostridium estertheticum]MBX4264470.1 CRISPR-associated helicase Cas3' [Clostridium estertheticum]WLC89308.1 CRISPR-associated helicase Cas3' [Clostridium estertheticum]
MEYKSLEDIELYDIDKTVLHGDLLYAHIGNKKKPELIIEHSQKTIDFFYKLSKTRGVNEILQKCIYNLKNKGKKIEDVQAKMILEFFVNAIYLHDMGKINPAFQFKKMKNFKIEFKKTAETSDSNHSMLSALIYVDIFLPKIQKIENRKVRGFLRNVLLSFSYVISRHHTKLTDFGESDFLQGLKDIKDTICENPSYLIYYKNSQGLQNQLNLSLLGDISKDKDNDFEFYILTKLLYSAIVSCDFYATYNYDTGNEPTFNYIDNVDSILKVYKNTDIYKGINSYKSDKEFFGMGSMNTLRSEMFLDAENSLLENLDHHNIFYLEAPTGSGKTNTSINLALNIVKRFPRYNKISYIFPFNTLIEQTKKVFNGIFNETVQKDFRVAVINSVTPIVTEAERNNENEEYDGKIDFKKDYLNRQMIQYPVALTTHINFFNYLFGTGREINLPLIHLCNSIVIIDEVQSYRNRIWPEIIKFLNAFAKILNIKIIIMSATLPKLDKLLHEETCGFCDLIKDKNKYYQNEIFRNRVKLNFELLGKEKNSKEEILSKIDEVVKRRDNTRLLIEFIKKTTAREFFNELKNEYPKKKIYEITGDDSNFIRTKILNEISSVDDDGNFICKDVIVVATQVIEAGVDIDMDIGFKDISMLDGEEQFLGRINRSCKRKDCEAFFFNYDAAEKIYRADFRLEFDLTYTKYQEYLINKNFEEFYENCFKRLEEKKSEKNKENIMNLDEAVLYLDFEKVSNMMKLIVEENYQLFLAHEIKNEQTGEVIVDGKVVWMEYKNLISDKEMDYSKRKIELSNVAQRMAYFTYNYNDYDNKNDKSPKFSNENIGRLYYIENGADYITSEGKFDRNKYKEDSGGGWFM